MPPLHCPALVHAAEGAQKVYEVIVTSSSKRYSVWRRFREFAALRQSLLALFKLPIETLRFPRRRLFSSRAATVRSIR